MAVTAIEAVAYALAACYWIVFAVALVQLVRIAHRNAPPDGRLCQLGAFTTQQKFHVLLLLLGGLRGTFFALGSVWTDGGRHSSGSLTPHGTESVQYYVLSAVPGLLILSLYSLLVLHWSSVYSNTTSRPELHRRYVHPAVGACNLLAYAGVGAVAALYPRAAPARRRALVVTASYAVGGLFFGAALLLALCGHRVYHRVLSRVPVEFHVLSGRMREVAWVTGTCAACFTARAAALCYTGARRAADAGAQDPPALVAAYFALLELLPCAVLLRHQRRMPPRRAWSPSAAMAAADGGDKGFGAAAGEGLLGGDSAVVTDVQ